MKCNSVDDNINKNFLNGRLDRIKEWSLDDLSLATRQRGTKKQANNNNNKNSSDSTHYDAGTRDTLIKSCENNYYFTVLKMSLSGRT